MAALAVSFVPTKHLHLPSSPGYSRKQSEQYPIHYSCRNLSLSPAFWGKVKFTTYNGGLAVRAGYSGDRGRPSSASIFVGGFILGGIIVGTLGCVFAPQISKALAGTDRKDLMRKLPKFIYDEEKALEVLETHDGSRCVYHKPNGMHGLGAHPVFTQTSLAGLSEILCQ